jgi:CubicO group peptidase (beta-lactamase class C family)
VPSLVLLAGLLFSVIAKSCPSETLFNAYDGTHPGASVIVIKDGKVVYDKSFGMANIETSEKASSQTNYRLASITKQFTAMAILVLEKKGSLKVDDPVTKYLPELAEVAPKVTIKHLLTHTSGLPEYSTLRPDTDTTQIVDKDVLALVKNAKRETFVAPGKRYKYLNTGYALLALVIERSSKLSYAEFLKRNIFTPLGMTQTMVYDAKAKIPNRAFGYSGSDDSFARKDQDRDTTVLGDGGVYSSTQDLVRWIDSLDNSTLIAPTRLAEACSPMVQTDNPAVRYGFGWRITEEKGERVVFHTGTTSGFKNALLWVPSKKLAVIVLTNRRQGDPLTLSYMVLDQYWDK